MTEIHRWGHLIDGRWSDAGAAGLRTHNPAHPQQAVGEYAAGAVADRKTDPNHIGDRMGHPSAKLDVRFHR